MTRNVIFICNIAHTKFGLIFPFLWYCLCAIVNQNLNLFALEFFIQNFTSEEDKFNPFRSVLLLPQNFTSAN